MRAAGAHQNGAAVFLEITGKGQYPNFKVGPPGDLSKHVAFDYDGPEFDTGVHTDTWSTKGMTWGDVMDLLDGIRAKRIKL